MTATEERWTVPEDGGGAWVGLEGDASGTPIGVAFISHGGLELARQRARLMAAAPDMLTALEAALEQTEDGCHQAPCDVPDCWVELVERAITKARGTEASDGD